MEDSNSGTSLVIVIAVALVALIVGFVGAKVMDKNDMTTTTTTVTTTPAPDAGTKAADLRSTLVTLGIQHMQLTDQAVDAALDGSADAAALKTELIANGTSISAAVGSIYGSAAQTQFQTLWNTHLTDFVNYAVADKEGNATAKTAALTDIQNNYTLPISTLLSGANPNLPDATLQTEFGDHVTMTAGVIDDHVAGNYAQEQTDLLAADTHIAGLMSTLAEAIVKQYPSKF